MRLSHPRPPALVIGLALAVTLLLGACGSGATPPTGTPDGKISVVASTNVYGSIAEAVGGELVSVHSIINKPGADPHSYEANAQDKLALSKAAVGIENGGGYDDFFVQLAKGTLTPEQILNVSDLSGLDTGADFNEHLWYSLPTMALVADNLAARFTAAKPAQSAAFTANAAAFKDHLSALETRLGALQASHGGKGVAITEPVPLYLLEQAGLMNKTPTEFSLAVENGSDVPATAMVDTVDLMGSGTIAMLAYNNQTEGPQTKAVKAAAQKAGVPVLDFSETLPASMDYIQWMDANVAQLENALGR
ncbi:metal ABC transporter solute-binding protein, Zn/Mn family [Arthrobacter alpinus]|uniref:metal ABC transporter solute-binding protein, Zn/Mn family n=1 Tax=Arthrobacter alpinus TaxID=656366 RepID=UPI0016452B9E|nr:zinc ABC transporter substrate-binding protein [Arthrobacter alpinus]